MIPRSSYYKWTKHEKSVQETENIMLIAEIVKVYDEVGGIYGYRRMTLNLNCRLGKNFNHKRIYRLMRLASLQSVIRRKKKRYVKSAPQQVAENLLNRTFSADRLNQK